MKRTGAYRSRRAGSQRTSRRRLLAVGAALLAFGGVAPASAQAPAAPSEATAPAIGDQMLLEADQLLYDFDAQTVTAVGNVKIYYDSYVLDAATLTYNQASGRLVASGGVRILEPGGNVITAESVDVTDDFRDGFLDSLNVVTTDRGRFSADTAERRDGELLVFRRGVYTACEPCLDHPERPPLWQIKAASIVHDRAKRTVYYRDARLEFLGVPIAYVPVFFHPDPSVTRKTGLLVPKFLGTDAIGYGVTTPFFWNLAPDYDVTFSPTLLSRQGLLTQAEWRQRLSSGAYSVRVAGIFQQDKDVFRADNGDPLSGYREFRGSARTTGAFSLTPRWTAGWDAHATTDRTFNRDYRIVGASAKDLASTAYLTGFSEQNFFDLRGYYFRVQRENTEEKLGDDGKPSTPDVYIHNDQDEQAAVHPVVDHNYIAPRPLMGGELRFDSNLTSLSRDESDIRHPRSPFDPYYAGVAGVFTRATTRATWQRRLIGPAGQVFTPFSYLQADANYVSADDPAAGLSSDDFIGRAMPAIGLEYEWPILATLGSSVHTFGPKAQIIARPDEKHPGELPNEDSHSLVFDDTNLFEFDKFSGYDRQEGGTRANMGFVYQALFENGAALDAVAGKSIQIDGTNSFALQDHALTGFGSGLEDDISDYVGRVTLNTGNGLSVVARGRFDDDDLTVNRGEVNAIGTFGKSVGSLGYAFIRESPSGGIFDDRQEVSASASLAVTDNWAVLGSMVYDIENTSKVTRGFGLAYGDECFDISAVYSETPDYYSDLVTGRQVFVRINLRTLGDSSLTSSLGGDTVAEPDFRQIGTR